MDNLASDNSTTTVADNPATEPVADVNGTGSANGQAQGAAPDDIFKGVDPRRLPPEVKAHYDSMLKDYRDKTARLSETTKSEVAKAVESYRQKAESYDQISTQDEFVKQWNDYVQKVQSTPKSEQAGNPELAQMKATLQEMNQKIQLSELTQVTDAFADAMDEKGQKVHPEFDNLNSISIGKIQNGQNAEDFSLLRGCIELAQGNSPAERLTNGYKMAKAVYDGIFESGKKVGMGRLQSKVMNGTLPPSNSVSEGLSVTEKRPKSAKEAMDMAKRGIAVSRE